MKKIRVPKNWVVAIDGPSGSGKSTIARLLAASLGLRYVDTGAMYRAVAWKALHRDVPIDSASRLTRLASTIRIGFRMIKGINHVYVDGKDVTSLIRTEQVSLAASAGSKIPGVRRVLQRLQKKLGRSGAVLEGRDIGTVVFPKAQVKFFLVASPLERARRRYQELKARGEDVSLSRIASDIRKRDRNDSNRDIHPLKPAHDSIPIDNTGLQPPDTLKIMLGHIRAKRN